METSAGVPLISMRPFAAAKWLAWLVSKESPRFTGSLPSYTKSATYLTASLPSFPYREHTKNTLGYTTLCSRYCKTTKQTCRNAGSWSSGECNWWPVSRHEPLDTRVFQILNSGKKKKKKRKKRKGKKRGGAIFNTSSTCLKPVFYSLTNSPFSVEIKITLNYNLLFIEKHAVLMSLSSTCIL